MAKVCKCGNSISQETINKVTLNGKYPHFADNLKCKSCTADKLNDVERVAGYMPSESKMRGQIIIAPADTVASFHSLSSRTGGIVAKGVRTGKSKTGWM